MTLQVNLVNLGSYPNDGTGDDLRSAFVKTNQNFQSIAENVVLNAANMGSGTPLFLDKNGNTLRFRSISSANANMSISYDSNGVTLNVIDSINSLAEDPTPTLAGVLILNGNNIEGFGNIDITGDITADTITGNFIGSFSGDISGNIDGNLTGDVTGNVTGNLTGNVTGNLTGNVTGQVSNISNHNLEDLGNVTSVAPTNGQALVWNGSSWTPGNVAPSSNTITNYDFGILSGVRDPFDLIMQFTNVDFGSIYDSTSVKLDLGPIVEGSVLYGLESSSSTVTEGNSFTVSLTTVNVENGTLIPYTITGVSSSDIDGDSLTGSFTVTNNFASISFTVSVDELVETETFTLTLNSVTPAVFVSVTLLDPGSEIPEYTEGNIDGGSPSTTSFTVVADGGSPSTTSFTVVADGGVAGGTLDGGTPGTISFTETIEGGDPSSIPTEIYDGGIVD